MTRVSTQYDYEALLTYSRRFVAGRHDLKHRVDHRDLAHELVLHEDLDEKKLFNLCTQLVGRSEMEHNTVSLHRPDVLDHRTMEYKYCYSCDDVLPVDYFYNGKNMLGSRCSRCHHREYYYEHHDKLKERGAAYGRKQREELADPYIMELLVKSGTPRQLITPQLVMEKREALLQKQRGKGTPERKRQNSKSQRHRDALSDSYITGLLAQKIPREQITLNMIAQKREQLRAQRQAKLEASGREAVS